MMKAKSQEGVVWLRAKKGDNYDMIKGKQTDEKSNFDEWIYTLRGTQSVPLRGQIPTRNLWTKFL